MNLDYKILGVRKQKKKEKERHNSDMMIVKTSTINDLEVHDFIFGCHGTFIDAQIMDVYNF